MGPPRSLRDSFTPLLALGRQRNNIDTNIEFLPGIQALALTFAEELLRRPGNLLTVDEAAAIRAYTIENGPYRALNRLLREENFQLLQPFADYLWLLMHGLKKCPGPRVPLVYRGVPLGVHESYNVGSIVTWCSFSSCTTRVDALANDEFLGVSGERTEFHITLTTNRARSIGHLSVMPEEDEILLPPNTRLLVMGKANRGHGLWVVQLLEQPCLFPILAFPDQPLNGPPINTQSARLRPAEVNPPPARESFWSRLFRWSGRRIPRPSNEVFHIYATNGVRDKMKEALRHYPDLVDVEDNNGQTALIKAVIFKRYTLVDLLLKYRANVNHVDRVW